MSPFQVEVINQVAARMRGASPDKRAAAALRTAHAHASSSGNAIDVPTLEKIMVAFGATRELRHP